MERLVLVDSMILSYLADAIAPGYRPDSDDALDQERVAALRLYFWDRLGVGQTAVEQSERTPDPDHRNRLDHLVAILMPEFRVEEWKEESVERRVGELMTLHRDENDCRIVAEAEALQADAIVTFDKRMRNRLRDAVEVALLFPSELWEQLGIPRGSPPIREPHPTNPLAARSFWRWD